MLTPSAYKRLVCVLVVFEFHYLLYPRVECFGPVVGFHFMPHFVLSSLITFGCSAMWASMSANAA